jgi:hypothetical protein
MGPTPRATIATIQEATNTMVTGSTAPICCSARSEITLLEPVTDGGEEQCGRMPVDGAVVEYQRHRHRRRHNGSAVAGDHSLGHAADA